VQQQDHTFVFWQRVDRRCHYAALVALLQLTGGIGAVVEWRVALTFPIDVALIVKTHQSILLRSHWVMGFFSRTDA
jgi:hypothetical protein